MVQLCNIAINFLVFLNVCGIFLTVVAAKIYDKLLLERIRSHLDPLPRINQSDFRPGSSTVAQTVTLRRLTEGVKAKQLQATITSVNFKKGFNSIHLGNLMEIRSAYGVLKKIVDAVSIFYKDTVAQVITPDGETILWDKTAGISKGDSLTPYFFIVVLDYILWESTKDSSTGFILEKR